MYQEINKHLLSLEIEYSFLKSNYSIMKYNNLIVKYKEKSKEPDKRNENIQV